MKKRVISALLVAAMALTAIPGQTFAGVSSKSVEDLSYDGYTKVWGDEFDGDSLNRADWNVETHEKGWVNNELQEYVDSDENIQVKDGKLIINPVEKVETITTTGAENLLLNADFANGIEGWTETIANWGGADGNADASRKIADGAIVYSINNAGSADWNVQLKQENIELQNGRTYKVSFKAKSTVTRKFKTGVMSASYEWFGGSEPELVANEEQEIQFSFTMPKDTPADFYISLGKYEDTDTPASEVTIYDISFTEEPANMIAGATFNDNAVEGVISKEITNTNMGSQPWDVQVLQGGVNVEAGETYEVSFKASSTVARTIVAGVQKTSPDYNQYGQGAFNITTEPTVYTYEVKSEATDENAGIYFNLGKSEGDVETPESTVTISDVKMIKKVVPGTTTKKSYTSGRISTQNKQTFTYGLFECRAKVPKGQGYLPAFWLMANDENVYGQWPRCGEIDCMEVMGQETDKVYGTIHYGNPHSESQGTAKTGAGESDFSDDFHTFACEWEPGVIKWYVDGKLYHEESDWYSTTVGQGTLTYPAPFDQPFYIILNLAVGGSWVGYPNDDTSFENNPFEIDYVRVYQKDSYDEDVKRPVKDVTLRDPDANGNYINNGDFSVEEDLTDDTDWKFMTALEGEATADIDNNAITIKTTKEGTVDYSVQLVQPNLPFEKGATYEVQFDAYASADREMGVDIKAPDHGYMSYMPHQDAQLTTEKQTYTYTFKMGDASDANGRLEYNMGSKGSTADIYISNVSVKKIKDADPNEKEVKTVLANGNYVYNGCFQEGDKHLGYWTVSNDENADITVTPFADGRRLKVAMDGNEKSAVVISQEELAFASGTPYRFSFNVESDADNTMTVNIGGHAYTVDIKANEEKDFAVEIPSNTEYANNDISITFGTNGTTWIDNVSLVENALIKNGSFNDGTTGYTVYVDSSANATYVVDSLKDDNALAVTVKDTGDQDWKVQVKQENIKLEKGKTYILKFKAKSSIDRQIRVIMQGKENRGYAVYSNDNVVDLTNEYKEFEDTFTMTEDTDSAAFFSVCLGKIGDNQITSQHEVRIDDISLEEVKEEVDDNDKEEIKDEDKEEIKDDDNGEIKDEDKEEIKDDDKEEVKDEDKEEVKGDDKEEVKDEVDSMPDSKEEGSVDNVSSAAIIDDKSVLPAGTKMASEKIESTSETYKYIEAVLEKYDVTGKFVAYELNLLDADNVMISGELGGVITVSLPVPEGLTVSADKTIVVYRVNDDETLVRCNTTVKDGKVFFETNHFSKYVFVEEEVKPSEEIKGDTKPVDKTEQPQANQTPSQSNGQTVANPSVVGNAKAAITPKTGDDTPIMVYIFGAIAGVIVLGASFSRKRKAN